MSITLRGARGRLSLLTACALVLTLFGTPASAAADTTVTSCDAASIQAAVDAGGVVTLDCDGQTIAFAATLTLTRNVELVGVGAVALDGNGSVRVIAVDAGVTATIRNLTVQGGDGVELGGGIANEGTLTVEDSLISNNAANAAGGIFNSGDLTVRNSSINDNRANIGGGAIRNVGTATISNSTIDDNESGSGGGGIINAGALTLAGSTVSDNYTGDQAGGGLNNGPDGVMLLVNSTVSGNVADDDGGGIANRGALTVINSTISDNHADETGGGIRNRQAGVVTVTNSLLVGNTDDDNNDECSGGQPVTSGGHNIVDDASCDFFGAGDQQDVLAADVNLGPLADNGGPTQTMLPGAGSLAIDAGDNAACAADPVNNVDQRGLPRPAGASCDVGAVEVGADVGRLAGIAVLRTACGNASATGFCLTWLVKVTAGGQAVAGIEVAATLTLPDGSQQSLTATTERSGGARFVTPVNAYGTYTLTVSGASLGGIDLAPSGANSRTIAITSRAGR